MPFAVTSNAVSAFPEQSSRMSVVFPERSSVSSWLPEQFSSPRTIQLSSEREDKTQSLQSRTVSIEPGMEIPPSCMGSGSVRDSSVPLPEQSSFASIAASDKSSVVSWLSEQSRAVSLVKFPMPVRSAISMPDSGRSVTSPHSVSDKAPSPSVSAFSWR